MNRLLKFERLGEKHLNLVLGWRTSRHVEEFMFTEIEHDTKKQVVWFEQVNKDKSKAYWVIYLGKTPIGLINLSEIDHINSRCNAGFYIGEIDYLNLGGVIPIYLYNYVFTDLKLNKIYGEVVSSNERILKIHQFHGFRKVGILKEHIIKNGHKVDVIVVELLSSEWSKLSRFRQQTATFP